MLLLPIVLTNLAFSRCLSAHPHAGSAGQSTDFQETVTSVIADRERRHVGGQLSRCCRWRGRNTYDGSSGGGKVVYLGFPFETITSTSVRNAYMADALSFFIPEPTQPLSFDLIDLLPDGNVRLVVSGAPGFNVLLLTSTNLSGWSVQTNLLNPSGTLQFTVHGIRETREGHAVEAISSEADNGSPSGRFSGNGTNSRNFSHSGSKSLFTSPLRQSVISPAASGYLSMTFLKENCG